MNDTELKVTGLFAKLADPAARDEVVAAYKEAGLGGERYGAVCPIFLDEERTQRCNKRICPQGWAFATSLENSGKYCMHRENYDGTEEYLDITKILEHHGLPWRPLRTLTRMRENKPNKKEKKNGKKDQGSAQRTGNGTKVGGTNPSLSDGSGEYGEAAGEVSSTSQLPREGSGTFGDYLDGKVDGTGRKDISPGDGSTGRARLFLAKRERERLSKENQEGTERGETLPRPTP